MTDRTDQEDRELDKARQQMTQGAPVTHGPAVNPGGEQELGGLVPPYEGRQTQGPGGAADSTTSSKAFDATNAPPPGPKPAVSAEERSGMSSTDTNPRDPNRVGESMTDKAYEDGPDHTEGVKGKSGRPYGDNTPEDMGIDGGSEPANEGAPRTPGAHGSN